jgi:hypothetical protein
MTVSLREEGELRGHDRGIDLGRARPGWAVEVRPDRAETQPTAFGT